MLVGWREGEYKQTNKTLVQVLVEISYKTEQQSIENSPTSLTAVIPKSPGARCPSK